MPTQRIDFQYIRQHSDIALVLQHHKITLVRDGQKEAQFKCLCPFHNDKKPSMKVNTDRNIYHCFTCDAGGNILDLAMNLEGIDIRPAAKLVAKICNIKTASNSSRRKKQKNPATGSASKKKFAKELKDKTPLDLDGIPVNRPLTFELKNLVTDHPILEMRGISEMMRDEFGLGVATRGIMANRLVFPIHNSDGCLVAYCGRYIGEDRTDDEPKYKQPPNFHKELELFNWHRINGQPKTSPLIVVESFFSVIKLHEMQYRCVSTMGRSLSKAHIQLLMEAGEKEVILLFDGDDPGRAATTIAGRQLLDAGIKVVAPIVQEGFKPHRENEKSLISIIGICR